MTVTHGRVSDDDLVNFLAFFKHTQPWMAVSPINKIARAKRPLLVLHGANDTNVTLVEAEQMVDELRKRNVEVASVIFRDEGHGFTKTANRTRSAVETLRWFASHL